MNSCFESVIEESAELHHAMQPGNKRFLSPEEIEELLWDLPMQMIDFHLDIPRVQRKIA